MKMKELQNMSETDLQRQLSALREQFRDLRFRIKSKEVKNSHELKAVRTDIARILTILNAGK
ncbi:MAG TPA: 50S ribosomal protein L29 [Patescibacteria group bacterium]|nr:50S ribosomal protein L29 [Patescibacteria group bacterium]